MQLTNEKNEVTHQMMEANNMATTGGYSIIFSCQFFYSMFSEKLGIEYNVEGLCVRCEIIY